MKEQKSFKAARSFVEAKINGFTEKVAEAMIRKAEREPEFQAPLQQLPRFYQQQQQFQPQYQPQFQPQYQPQPDFNPQFQGGPPGRPRGRRGGMPDPGPAGHMPREPGQPVFRGFCRDQETTEGCKFGDKCKYMHKPK
jgi:hypothetical protein